MDAEEFKRRTKLFAIEIIRVVAALPHTTTALVIGRQLLKAGCSVGANYRAACRARSRADFIGKMKIVEEECDESIYWMELLTEEKQLKAYLKPELLKEGNEILSIVVASIRTARSNT